MTSGSEEHLIIIYNIISFKPDLIIKEHRKNVNFLLEISSGIQLKNKQLVSCSYDYDNSIIIFSKENNEYKMDYKIENGMDCRCYSVIETKFVILIIMEGGNLIFAFMIY